MTAQSAKILGRDGTLTVHCVVVRPGCGDVEMGSVVLFRV